MNLVLAAEFLDARQLLSDACQDIASRLRDATVDEIQDRFGLRSDMTHEEQADVRCAYAVRLTKCAAPCPTDRPTPEPKYPTVEARNHDDSERAIAVAVACTQLPLFVCGEVAQCTRKLRDEIQLKHPVRTETQQREVARAYRERQSELWCLMDGELARPWRAAASLYVNLGFGDHASIRGRVKSWTAYLGLPKHCQTLLRYHAVVPKHNENDNIRDDDGDDGDDEGEGEDLEIRESQSLPVMLGYDSGGGSCSDVSSNAVSCNVLLEQEVPVVLSESMFAPPDAEELWKVLEIRLDRDARFNAVLNAGAHASGDLQKLRAVFVASESDDTRAAIIARAERETTLCLALAKAGCTLPRNSNMCTSYIWGDVGDADKIVATIEELQWLYANTDYGARVAVEMDAHMHYLRSMGRYFGGSGADGQSTGSRDHMLESMDAMSDSVKYEIAYSHAMRVRGGCASMIGLPKMFLDRVEMY